jgi:ParB family chromosome partitioning protein
LAELAASIREKGIIQPLIVRPDPTDADRYQIVAGERRWRAAQLAQLHDLPVIVRDFDDTEVLEVAIIENIQRADLNALEEAQGYKQLIERFGHTQDQLAQAMGKSRSHIANLMRLLALPDPIQDMLRAGQLSAGHARALLTADDPIALARKAIASGWSVRDVKKHAKSPNPSGRQGRSQRPGGAKDADTVALEGDLSATLGMAVTIDHDAATGEGRVTIRYRDLQALDDLIRVLNRG